MNPPRRLRIALVIEDVGLGGGQERVLAELAPRLARRHDVHLFSFTVRDIDLAGITLHRLPDPPLPLGARALWFVLASSLTINPRRYDVVLAQGGNTLVQNFTLLHTGHSERRSARLQIQRRLRPRPASRRAWEWLRDALFIRLEGRAVRRCRPRVLVISRSIRDYVIREWDLQPDEVHVTRNGVDHAVFRPELRESARPRLRSELGLSEERFVALFMGGRWFDKGLPEVIEAVSRCETHPHLAVVGRGDREHFAARAEHLGVGGRVSFIPHVDRPQDYFAMADCLVHPNPIEPFGLVVLEAAACGLPVLAARSGVALDLIDDGVTGLFVERDPGEIAQGLDRLAADRELTRRMGERIHERSLRFSWDRQAEEIERLFLRLTGADGEARR